MVLAVELEPPEIRRHATVLRMLLPPEDEDQGLQTAEDGTAEDETGPAEVGEIAVNVPADKDNRLHQAQRLS